MKTIWGRIVLLLALVAAAWLWNGDVSMTLNLGPLSIAEAIRGRPATPVSYAGVARRTPVRVATPGIGAPGVGVMPGVGVGAPGVGAAPANRGGPVNRVGRR